MNALKTWLVVAGPAAGRRLRCVGAGAGTVLPARSLAAARTLYASAEYGGALDMLNGLLSENPPAPTGRPSSSIARCASWPSATSTEASRIIEA